MINIVSIVRDEGRYIREWICWHIVQGIDHFYIYDNASTDNSPEIYKDYIDAGIMTVRSWPYTIPRNHTQIKAYQHFLQNHSGMTDWCAFIDSDEFLYFDRENTVKDWFNNHLPHLNPPSALAGVGVPWMLYGSDGQLEYKDGFVVERFTKRQKLLNSHIKSIIIPKHILSVGRDVHSFRAKPGFKMINSFGEHMPDATPHFADRELTVNVLRCNHYHTKSKEEYRARCDRGRIDYPVKRDFDSNFALHDKNEIEDPEPLVWIEKVIGKTYG